MNNMKIYLLGDIGHLNENTKKIFESIMNDKDEKKIFLLGDNFYPNGLNSHDDLIWKTYQNLNIDVPVFGILGNHDYLGNVKIQLEHKEKNWNIPYFYYKKSFDDVDFFFIDTSILLPEHSNINYTIVKSKIGREPIEVSKEMMDWLDDELLNSDKIKVVLGHYPLFSYGVYGINRSLFNILYPLFSKHKVDYYVSGHDHNLQIIDVTSEKFSMKQIVSGATSHLYPLLKNVSSKIFSEFGCVLMDTTSEEVTILDQNLKTLYIEKLQKN